MSTEKCIVCEGEKLQPLIYYYSRYLTKLFHRIAICFECGHVQVNPLFSKGELEKINNQFFGSLFMEGNKQNLANNQVKLRKLDERLSPFISERMNVLDVGAGEGWAMDYFQKKGCIYYAIEAVPRLVESIVVNGGGSYRQ